MHLVHDNVGDALQHRVTQQPPQHHTWQCTGADSLRGRLLQNVVGMHIREWLALRAKYSKGMSRLAQVPDLSAHLWCRTGGGVRALRLESSLTE